MVIINNQVIIIIIKFKINGIMYVINIATIIIILVSVYIHKKKKSTALFIEIINILIKIDWLHLIILMQFNYAFCNNVILLVATGSKYEIKLINE